MKRALIVSAFFTPSNLAGVMRPRFLATHLAEFGWQPIVVTVAAAQYEEPGDEASLSLLPPALRVERAGAWPSRICRPLGFGDVSLRAQSALRRKVGELVQQGEADLIFCTVLPGYTSLVGAWAKRKFNLPFVLDYQDPWVTDAGARQPRFSKAGLAHWLATRLEPGAVKCADALTAVSADTLRTLRERSLLRTDLPVETIPIGADAQDHTVAKRTGRSWINRGENEFVFAYTGTIIESMIPTVRTFFRAVRTLLDANPSRRLRVHFIGTSARPDGRDMLGLERLAEEIGVSKIFRLEPRRIGYLDALRTMQDADALLLFGSSDAHYTASKIFPCWLTGKPVLALFHAASTINQLARELGGVRVVSYDQENGAEQQLDKLTSALHGLMEHGLAALPSRNEAAFEPYSARGTAQRYAQLFDQVTNRPHL